MLGTRFIAITAWCADHLATYERVEVDQLGGDVNLVLDLHTPDVVVDLVQHLVTLHTTTTWV